MAHVDDPMFGAAFRTTPKKKPVLAEYMSQRLGSVPGLLPPPLFAGSLGAAAPQQGGPLPQLGFGLPGAQAPPAAAAPPVSPVVEAAAAGPPAGTVVGTAGPGFGGTPASTPVDITPPPPRVPTPGETYGLERSAYLTRTGSGLNVPAALDLYGRDRFGAEQQAATSRARAGAMGAQNALTQAIYGPETEAAIDLRNVAMGDRASYLGDAQRQQEAMSPIVAATLQAPAAPTPLPGAGYQSPDVQIDPRTRLEFSGDMANRAAARPATEMGQLTQENAVLDALLGKYPAPGTTPLSTPAGGAPLMPPPPPPATPPTPGLTPEELERRRRGNRKPVVV